LLFFKYNELTRTEIIHFGWVYTAKTSNKQRNGRPARLYPQQSRSYCPFPSIMFRKFICMVLLMS